MERQKSRIVARMRASGYLPDEIEDENLEESFQVASSTEIAVSTAPIGDTLPISGK